MKTAEIKALVRAHGGRVRPVVSLHLLRQRALGAEAQAFLLENIGHLEIVDLLRWRALCERGHTGAILAEIVRRAALDPGDFAHEVLGAPRLGLDADEWRELHDSLRGKLPERVWEKLVRRSEAAARNGNTAVHGEGAPPVVVLSPRTLALFDEAELADTGLFALEAGEGDSGAGASPDELWLRFRQAGRAADRLALLDRLEQLGSDRKALVDAAIALLAAADTPDDVVVALARGLLPRQMGTRAAWERFGEALVSALVARRAWGEASEILALVWAANAAEGEAQRGLLVAIQWALGKTLVDEARSALARGDEQAALGVLSALLCLDPPARLSRGVHALRHAPGASPDVLDLVAVNERMIKHGRGGDASLEDVIAAVHALADALGSEGAKWPT
jgi:hypothetical protein